MLTDNKLWTPRYPKHADLLLIARSREPNQISPAVECFLLMSAALLFVLALDSLACLDLKCAEGAEGKCRSPHCIQCESWLFVFSFCLVPSGCQELVVVLICKPGSIHWVCPVGLRPSLPHTAYRTQPTAYSLPHSYICILILYLFSFFFPIY